MAYVASIHRASSVRHALSCYFMLPEEQSLIVAKANRLEIYQFNDGSLTLSHSVTVYGHITVLLTLRPENSLTDHLFVSTDRYHFFTISWDSERQTIRNERTGKNISDRFLRNAKYGPFYLADPQRRLLGLHIYQGVFTVIPLIQPQKGKRKKPAASGTGGPMATTTTVAGGASVGTVDDAIGNLDEAQPIRLLELKVLSMAFLDSQPEPVLALLYEDGQNDVHLKCYRAKISGKSKDKELEDMEIPQKIESEKGSIIPLDPGSKIIIPVEGEDGRMLIIGEQTVLNVSISKGKYTGSRGVVPEPTVFTAWGKLDVQNYVLGDDYGKLYHVQLRLDEKRPDIRKLGEISVPTKLVPLGNGYVFVGSHSGDSQLIRINPGAEMPVEGVQVIQTFSNLAPVLDFRILDIGYSGSENQHHLYSSGQTRIVSGSGALQDGSLRSLRSGVGLDELGILGDMAGIRGLWGLKSNPASKFHDTLLVSFIDETRVFQFNSEGDVEELDSFNGFSLDECTIDSGNVSNTRILQVTHSLAKLADPDSGATIAEWRPPTGKKINMASHNEDSLVLSYGGSHLAYLDIRGDLKEISCRTFEHEIASLAVPAPPSYICIVGSWVTSNVSIITLPNLQTVLEQDVSSKEIGAIPRSLLLANLLEGQLPTLLVAMSDGRLYSFTFDENSMSLTQKKDITLGTQPVYLRVIPRGAQGKVVNVFATCDHPSLLYGSEGRIVYSAVRAENATFVAPFNAEAYPDSVVVASDEDLKITAVDPARTTHIQKLHVGDIVRRVCHSKDRRIFGLATLHQQVEMETGIEKFQSYVRIVDDVIFDIVDSYKLDKDEMVETIMCARLDDGDGERSEKLVVGTGYEDGELDIPVKGRILVFDITEEKRLKLVMQEQVRGGVRCLDILDRLIVAALHRSVVVYSYEFPNSPTKPAFRKLASYKAQSDPMDLSVYGKTIAVADVMKGVSLLQFKWDKSPEDGTLVEVARNYSTQWSTAVCLLDEDTAVSSDGEGNVIIQKRDVNGVTEEDRRKLRTVGDMRLGEMVNRIRKIDGIPLLDSIITPAAYLGTTEGSIYLLGLISSMANQDLLMQLQANLAKHVKGPGDIGFSNFRSFSTTERTAEEPFRFVDGDFLERFLELDEERMERVVGGEREGEGLKVGVEEVKSVVENLKRLH